MNKIVFIVEQGTNEAFQSKAKAYRIVIIIIMNIF